MIEPLVRIEGLRYRYPGLRPSACARSNWTWSRES